MRAGRGRWKMTCAASATCTLTAAHLRRPDLGMTRPWAGAVAGTTSTSRASPSGCRRRTHAPSAAEPGSLQARTRQSLNRPRTSRAPCLRWRPGHQLVGRGHVKPPDRLHGLSGFPPPLATTPPPRRGWGRADGLQGCMVCRPGTFQTPPRVEVGGMATLRARGCGRSHDARLQAWPALWAVDARPHRPLGTLSRRV